MMLRLLLATIAVAAATAAANAQQRYPATLVGHAILPANALIAPPADAPEALRISGRFTGPNSFRTDQVGSVPGATGSGPGRRTTGLSLPFQGQPVQGFSGIRAIGDGSYWVLTDNGFGARINSPDAMLMFHRVRPSWESGAVERVETIFLSDPNRHMPFRIVNENTRERYLTGGDLDIEAIQPIGDSFWFGDEFGPFLVRTDRQGRVTGFWETQLRGEVVRSPDHPALTMPARADGRTAFRGRRSGGYEGMAQSPDGRFLYALLEGPLWDAQANNFEMAEGREYLRIIEFDVQAARWTGRNWRYRLEANGNAIGDFNMIDATRGMIIERDNGEGHPAQACPENRPAATCFATPARLKRVYMVSLEGVADDGFVRKLGCIDLMDIADPNNRARQGGTDGRLSFPFVTIENVDRVDAEHIIVANDNNLPFSAGRRLDRADDNEFILLRVPEFLSAR